MSYLKTKTEIEKMTAAGRISAKAMALVGKLVKPGITTLELDKKVEEVFKQAGADSAFKQVEGYKFSICSTPNNQVVHGLPNNEPLVTGDIVGIDLGALFQGYNSDMAQTFAVGKVTAGVSRFLRTGEEALAKALAQAQVGNHIGDISSAIQTVIEKAGYSVVREFVGHGVGKELHEEPWVPGIGKKGSGERLEEGLVIAIEIIYNQGKSGVALLPDGWTVVTKDSSLSGLFERTVAITDKGPVVLTAE